MGAAVANACCGQDREAAKILWSSHTEHFTQALELSERGARLSSQTTGLDVQLWPRKTRKLCDITTCRTATRLRTRLATSKLGQSKKDASGMSGGGPKALGSFRPCLDCVAAILTPGSRNFAL
jgi:hypothetical protein